MLSEDWEGLGHLNNGDLICSVCPGLEAEKDASPMWTFCT